MPLDFQLIDRIYGDKDMAQKQIGYSVTDPGARREFAMEVMKKVMDEVVVQTPHEIAKKSFAIAQAMMDENHRLTRAELDAAMKRRDQEEQEQATRPQPAQPRGFIGLLKRLWGPPIS